MPPLPGVQVNRFIMSPFLAVLLVVLMLALVVWLKWLPPLGAVTLVRVRHGVVEVTRGHVSAPARADLTDVLCAAGVAGGYIAIDGSGRCTISRGIPADLHQRIRNIVCNP